MQPVKLSITGLQHVGIPVTDLKVSETFYQNLGFAKVMESSFEFKNDRGRCTMMKLGSVMIELYHLPPSELQGIKNRSDGHIDHIAFDVDDINQTFAALMNAGYTILEKTSSHLNFWAKGCKFFNILGPDGERLEFNQIL
jgi:catechol 2,3-dioxygenase-like lactoylglutathione lyase family enzyme